MTETNPSGTYTTGHWKEKAWLFSKGIFFTIISCLKTCHWDYNQWSQTFYQNLYQKLKYMYSYNYFIFTNNEYRLEKIIISSGCIVLFIVEVQQLYIS